MKSMNLLLALGNVKGSYLLSAGEFREGKPKLLARKRLWLIAAVIALRLVLVGCAVVYALGLQDMAFGQKHREYYDGSSQTATLRAIQGAQLEADGKEIDYVRQGNVLKDFFTCGVCLNNEKGKNPRAPGMILHKLFTGSALDNGSLDAL